MAGGGSATVERVAPVEPGTFAVPADQAWTSTGVTLAIGQKLLIEEVEHAKIRVTKTRAVPNIASASAVYEGGRA